MHDECRSHDLEAQNIHKAWGFMRGHFLVKNHAFDERGSTSAILLRPGNAGPSPFIDFLLPCLQKGKILG